MAVLEGLHMAWHAVGADGAHGAWDVGLLEKYSVRFSFVFLGGLFSVPMLVLLVIWTKISCFSTDSMSR